MSTKQDLPFNKPVKIPIVKTIIDIVKEINKVKFKIIKVIFLPTFICLIIGFLLPHILNIVLPNASYNYIFFILIFCTAFYFSTILSSYDLREESL